MAQFDRKITFRGVGGFSQGLWAGGGCGGVAQVEVGWSGHLRKSSHLPPPRKSIFSHIAPIFAQWRGTPRVFKIPSGFGGSGQKSSPKISESPIHILTFVPDNLIVFIIWNKKCPKLQFFSQITDIIKGTFLTFLPDNVVCF